MYIGRQEWQQLQAGTGAAPAASRQSFRLGPLALLYHRLADGEPDDVSRAQAAQFLRGELHAVAGDRADLPASPEGLLDWMEANARSVHERYGAYLDQRRAGAPRRYFKSRAHALYTLRCIAPTKLVDGAWLYGLVAHWRNPRLSDLVRTYVEELGEGTIDKNHVVLYRALLARHALDPLDGLDDGLYRQGLIQLALGWNATEFLPEIVGFNLGYEQLPLHLLITAYELNELGIDPYYFTLHVTVDNADSGHARRACQAVLDLLPRVGREAFWKRVREGSKLACAGVGTTDVIDGFDAQAEVVRILRHKAPSGSGAHSDYCRVAGRHVNDWLADPLQMPAFLRALEDAGWIRRGEPAANSRFWKLLQGERAEMFGVFSGYELQVIHDWIRCEASADGRPYTQAEGDSGRRPTFRAAARNGLVRGPAPAGSDLLDPELDAFRETIAVASQAQREATLVRFMSPAMHWTPAGMEATRLFWRERTG